MNQSLAARVPSEHPRPKHASFTRGCSFIIEVGERRNYRTVFDDSARLRQFLLNYADDCTVAFRSDMRDLKADTR